MGRMEKWGGAGAGVSLRMSRERNRRRKIGCGIRQERVKSYTKPEGQKQEQTHAPTWEKNERVNGTRDYHPAVNAAQCVKLRRELGEKEMMKGKKELISRKDAKAQRKRRGCFLKSGSRMGRSCGTSVFRKPVFREERVGERRREELRKEGAMAFLLK